MISGPKGRHMDTKYCKIPYKTWGKRWFLVQKDTKMDTNKPKSLMKPVENDAFWSKRDHDEY